MYVVKSSKLSNAITVTVSYYLIHWTFDPKSRSGNHINGAIIWFSRFVHISFCDVADFNHKW